MTSPSLEMLFRILDVFEQALSTGKIAVHCHAGTGRTIVAICAWLLYSSEMRAFEVIRLCEGRRKGVLGRTAQRETIAQLEAFIKDCRDSALRAKLPYEVLTDRLHAITIGQAKHRSRDCPLLVSFIIEQLEAIRKEDQKSVLEGWVEPGFGTHWGP
jgi:hypothetical protein